MMKKKKTVWIIIAIISTVIVIGGIGFLVYSFTSPQVTRDDFTSSQSDSAATKDEAKTADETTTAGSAAAGSEKFAAGDFGYELEEPGEFAVDFDELMQINRDVYAWITVPNTKVDYPVARSTTSGDDSFYLEHNVYGQYQFSGTIYSELQNNPDFHDPVTVLYGHNMLNGSMFATLHNFEDKDFFDENKTVFIYTKDKIYTYLIYAAYTYDDRHILNSGFFTDKELFQEYLDSTLNPHSVNANVREGVELDENSRILVLSTCTNGSSNTRYLVQGVLAYEQER